MSKAKKIQQSTFDAIVRENAVDLEMSPEEAVADAVAQLTAQGVDLSGIVTQPLISVEPDGVTISHPVVDSLQQFQKLLSPNPDEKLLLPYLQTVRTECSIDLAHRFLARDHGAFAILQDAWEKISSSSCVVIFEAIVDALIAVGNGQPDCFGERMLRLICQTLVPDAIGDPLCGKILRLLQITCTMHEKNRQILMENGILASLMKTLTVHHRSDAAVRAACNFLRTLISDDDVRVEFGHAHDYAKLVVVEHAGLKVLTDLLKEHIDKPSLVSEILLTMSRLSVRHEFCKDLVELGVLEEVQQLLLNSANDQNLVRNILALLKAVAGNDDVKMQIMKSGAGSLIVTVMSKHEMSVAVSEMGCATLSMLALRSPTNCTTIVEAGGPGVIIKAMQIHKNESKVQMQACMAIRNLVARTREYCDAFLDLGAEELIRAAHEQHPQLQDETKAALRDLGADVHLKELWTGKKGDFTAK